MRKISSLASCFAPVLAMHPQTSAADFAVTTAADEFDGICDVHCSLRDAVVLTNGTPGANGLCCTRKTMNSVGRHRSTLGVPIDGTTTSLAIWTSLAADHSRVS
jgi:CSLREA domain-containing protein